MYGRSTAPLRFMYVSGLISRTLTLPTDAGRDARLAVLSPAVKTPNVGEVVDDPPADVVTRALVFLARIAQSNDDFHRLVVARRGRCASAAPEQEAEHERAYLVSASSSAFVLRMSSGSAAAPAATSPSAPATRLDDRLRRRADADRRAGVVEHHHALGKLDVANVEAVSDRQRGDVDVDVIGNDRRIDANVHLVHRLLEDAARVANALGDADEAQRNADGDLLAGDELLEVDVEDVALERVALDLADERLRDVLPPTRELDDRARRRDLAQELVDVARDDARATAARGRVRR